MGFLSGFLKVVTIVPACVEVISGTVDAVRKMRSNVPRAKYEALQKCKEESKRLHENAVSEMKTMFNEAEEAAKRAQEAAERRIKEQRAENNEALESMRRKIKESEEQHDEEIKRMEREHAEKMKTSRAETNEAREKADRDHAAKISKVEREHKEAVKIAQEKLEATKREGEKKVQEAEREKDAIVRERNEVLEVFGREMRKLMDENQKQLSLIQKTNDDLRIENIQERRKQIEETHRLTIEQIEQRTQELVKNLAVETSADVVKQFGMILEPVSEINSSLQQILTECAPGSVVPPGILDPDFAVLKQMKALYQSRTHRYRQFVITARFAHPEIVRMCAMFISRMDEKIGSMELAALITHFPRAIDSGVTDEVRANYGKAARLNEEISQMRKSIDTQFHQTIERVLIETNMIAGANGMSIENN